MKDSVVIRFRYKGIEYTGKLNKVAGAGDTYTFYLLVENYYWGRLRYSTFETKWVFDPAPNTEGLEVLAEWMGGKVQE